MIRSTTMSVARLVLVLLAASACGVGGADGPDGAPADPRLGMFTGTYSETGTITTPPGTPPVVFDDPGTIIITIGATSDYVISGMSTATGEFCTFFADRSGDQAVIRTGQTCSGTLPNGSTQTATIEGGASVDGDELTLPVSGSMNGVNQMGTIYSGTYVGMWSCTRD